MNVATRQVMASDSLRGEAPSVAPTTLGAGVDSDKMLEDMTSELVNQVVTSVLRRTFPVTVVSSDGTNVVLSQGGQALKEGSRYQMVAMGAEMKDPQTGQSLGRVEQPCCELVVERVTPNLSYGRLENVRSNLEQLPVGGPAAARRTQGRRGGQGAADRNSCGWRAARRGAPGSSRCGSRSLGGRRGGAPTGKVVQPRPAPAAAPAAPAKNDDKW